MRPPSSDTYAIHLPSGAKDGVISLAGEAATSIHAFFSSDHTPTSGLSLAYRIPTRNFPSADQSRGNRYSLGIAAIVRGLPSARLLTIRAPLGCAAIEYAISSPLDDHTGTLRTTGSNVKRLTAPSPMSTIQMSFSPVSRPRRTATRFPSGETRSVM